MGEGSPGQVGSARRSGDPRVWSKLLLTKQASQAWERREGGCCWYRWESSSVVCRQRLSVARVNGDHRSAIGRGRRSYDPTRRSLKTPGTRGSCLSL